MYLCLLYLLEVLIFLSLCNALLCLLLPYLSWGLCMWHKYGYTHFLWLPFTQSITFHPFTLRPCVSLELKQVPGRDHAIQPSFIIHPVTLCLLIDKFSPFIVWIIVVKQQLTNADLPFWLFCISIVYFFLVFLYTFYLLIYFGYAWSMQKSLG